ncbi:MAG: hypothetical protein HYW03_15250 [Deltaproteobacteria bacterium]|nr:hypothetical protein [Deltaproteobacteria bacterium]
MDHKVLRKAVFSLSVILLLAVQSAQGEQIRLAMPSKSMTFLNFYVAEKFGFYKAEGFDVSFAVGKADVQLAAVMEDFQLDRKTTEASYREIIRTFAKEGMTTEEGVRSDIDSIRDQVKLKGQVPIGQVVDYGLLKEVLAGVK